MCQALLLFNVMQASYANVECALILLKAFGSAEILYVFDNDDHFLDMSAIVEIEGSFTSVNVNQDFYGQQRNYDLMMANVKNLSSLNVFFNKIYRTSYWNKSAYFVLVNLTFDLAETALKIAWRYYLLKLIIVTRDLRLYSYRPISDGGCEVLSPLTAGHCREFDGFVFDYDLIDFNGCRLRVGSVKLPPYVIDERSEANPGYEVVMMREIQARINVVYAYVEHNYTNHGKRVNGSVDALYGMLSGKQLDVVVGAPKAEGYLVDIFDGSRCYTSMSMGVYVRSANLQNPSSKFFRIFNLRLWLLIAFTMLAILISLQIFDGLNRTERSLSCNLVLLLNVAFSAHSMKTNHVYVSSIYLIWCFASFFLTTVFTNTFMTFLAIPSYEKQLDTLEDVLGAGLRIGGYIVTRSIAQDQNATFDRIYDEWVSCTLQGDECIRETLEGRMAIVKNTRSISFHLGIFNKRAVHLTTILTNNLLWLVMDKGLPMAERTNDVIEWMLHSGLMNKWEFDSMNVKRDKPDQQTITLYITSGFILLGCGLAIASVQFLAETLFHCKWKRSICNRNPSGCQENAFAEN